MKYGRNTGSTTLVKNLLERGEKVRAVNRSGKSSFPAEAVAADAANAQQMREVCAGATAVYNLVRPPLTDWRTTFPDVTRSLIAAAGAAGAVLAFADDTWMYGKVDRPMTEDMPSRPVSNLGVLRAWLAEMLLAAEHRGDVRVVIARAGELYGPKVESLFGPNLFGRALAGKRPLWFGDPDLPITPTYIDDFAATLATLATSPDTWGEVWHVPSGPPTTARRFAQQISDARLVAVPARLGRPLGLVSTVAKLGAEILYQFEQPFIVDAAKYIARFGGEATSHETGIAETVSWYRRQPRRSSLPV